jgi:hypothetical protein
MEISDDELRALVRESVARHLKSEGPQHRPAASTSGHASHILFPLTRGGDTDGACLIEPSVRCNHCGYCLSLGH